MLWTVFGLCFLLIPACDPPLTDNGVIAVVGERGLATGAFSYPRAIAAGPEGDVYVVDKTGRVQRFAANGTFETMWRMPETKKGKPVGLTVHLDGRVFVADTHYHRVTIFTRDGELLGTFGQYGEGDGELLLPTDVAVDEEGFIYVSEYGGNDRITKWSPALRFVGVVTGQEIDGLPLRRPAGIDIDEEQTLWVADACNHRVLRLSRDGALLATFGAFGEQPGQLKYPYDVTVGPDRTIMVCEYGGNRLQWFGRDGRPLRHWGRPGRQAGEVSAPWGATYGQDGWVYVADSLNNRMQIIRP